MATYFLWSSCWRKNADHGIIFLLSYYWRIIEQYSRESVLLKGPWKCWANISKESFLLLVYATNLVTLPRCECFHLTVGFLIIYNYYYKLILLIIYNRLIDFRITYYSLLAKMRWVPFWQNFTPNESPFSNGVTKFTFANYNIPICTCNVIRWTLRIFVSCVTKIAQMSTSLISWKTKTSFWDGGSTFHGTLFLRKLLSTRNWILIL